MLSGSFFIFALTVLHANVGCDANDDDAASLLQTKAAVLGDEANTNPGTDITVIDGQQIFRVPATLSNNIDNAVAACASARAGAKPLGNYPNSANTCGDRVQVVSHSGELYSQLGDNTVAAGNYGSNDANCGHGGNQFIGQCPTSMWCSESAQNGVDIACAIPQAGNGPSGGFVLATGFNQNCDQICAQAGGKSSGCGKPYADAPWYHWDNSFEPAKSQAEAEAVAIFKANGFDCPHYHWSGSGFVYESRAKACYIPVPNGNVLCQHRQSNYRTMCYCDGVNGYPTIEETTTTTTTENPAWADFVFGTGYNQNCDQVCAAAGGECNSEGSGKYSEQSWYHNFGWTNQFEPAKSNSEKEMLAVFKSKGFDCQSGGNSYHWSGSGFLYESSQRKCYLPAWNGGYSCGHRQTNYRLMCWCGPKQTTTTTTTTADPDWANFVLGAGFNQNCDEICAAAGGECNSEGTYYKDQSWYTWDNTKEPERSFGQREARAIFKAKGFECPNSYDKWSGSGFVFESKGNECYWPDPMGHYNCGHKQSNYRTMCRCSGGVFDPTTTTTTQATSTTTPTQFRCSLGPRNTNGDCPAGSEPIASAADCEACKDGLAGNDVDDYNVGYKPEDIWWASSGNWGGDVKGCYLNTQANSLYFNVAATGAPSPYMRPICGGGAIPPSEVTPAPTPAKVCRKSCHRGEYIKKKSCSRVEKCGGCCECTGECTPKSKPRRQKKCLDKCYKKKGDQAMKKHMCHKNKCGACPECTTPQTSDTCDDSCYTAKGALDQEKQCGKPKCAGCTECVNSFLEAEADEDDADDDVEDDDFEDDDVEDDEDVA